MSFPTSPPSAVALAEFNELPRSGCLGFLHTFLDVDSWANWVCDKRPYANIGALRAESAAAGTSMTAEEIMGALARHPRIGGHLDDGSAEAEYSRREQRDVVAGHHAADLAAANAAYEETFGFIFVIRAAGRTTAEILSALRSRLSNHLAAEIDVVRDQLLEIADLRIASEVYP